MLILLSLFFLGLSAFPHHFQANNYAVPTSKVYDAIIIGAGVAGIAASKTLSDQGKPHLILEARHRIGGRIVSSELDGVQVDLGASFIHNPGTDNFVDQLVKKMNWETVLAKMYLVDEHFKYAREPTADEAAQASKLVKEFQTWAYGYLKTLNRNTDLNSCWNQFHKSKIGYYS